MASLFLPASKQIALINTHYQIGFAFFQSSYCVIFHSELTFTKAIRSSLSNNFFTTRFLGSEDITNFFSRAQRSRIVFEILCTTPFGREKKGEVGVV